MEKGGKKKERQTKTAAWMKWMFIVLYYTELRLLEPARDQVKKA